MVTQTEVAVICNWAAVVFDDIKIRKAFYIQPSNCVFLNLSAIVSFNPPGQVEFDTDFL